MSDAGRVVVSWDDPLPAGLLLGEQPHVFAFRLDVPASRLAELHRLLSPDEVERAARFHRAVHRSRYVAARGRLRTILGRFLGERPDALVFRYGAQGKPLLGGGPEHERVRFNLSRSHELGILAIQLDEELGTDVEWIRPLPRALDIAERFFAPSEHDALRSLPAGERDAAFFDYWTRKEAIVKSIGLGLTQPMDAFVLGAPPGPPVERVVITGVGGGATRWCLTLPPPAPGYVAALATGGALRSPRCWAWSDPRSAHQ